MVAARTRMVRSSLVLVIRRRLARQVWARLLSKDVTVVARPAKVVHAEMGREKAPRGEGRASLALIHPRVAAPILPVRQIRRFDTPS